VEDRKESSGEFCSGINVLRKMICREEGCMGSKEDLFLHLHVIAGKDTGSGTDYSGPVHMLAICKRVRRRKHIPPVIRAISLLRDSYDITLLEAQIPRLVRIKGKQRDGLIAPQAPRFALE
jgi:hypothetical protein